MRRVSTGAILHQTVDDALGNTGRWLDTTFEERDACVITSWMWGAFGNGRVKAACEVRPRSVVPCLVLGIDHGLAVLYGIAELAAVLRL